MATRKSNGFEGLDGQELLQQTAEQVRAMVTEAVDESNPVALRAFCDRADVVLGDLARIRGSIEKLKLPVRLAPVQEIEADLRARVTRYRKIIGQQEDPLVARLEQLERLLGAQGAQLERLLAGMALGGALESPEANPGLDTVTINRVADKWNAANLTETLTMDLARTALGTEVPPEHLDAAARAMIARVAELRAAHNVFRERVVGIANAFMDARILANNDMLPDKADMESQLRTVGITNPDELNTAVGIFGYIAQQRVNRLVRENATVRHKLDEIAEDVFDRHPGMDDRLARNTWNTDRQLPRAGTYAARTLEMTMYGIAGGASVADLAVGGATVAGSIAGHLIGERIGNIVGRIMRASGASQSSIEDVRARIAYGGRLAGGAAGFGVTLAYSGPIGWLATAIGGALGAVAGPVVAYVEPSRNAHDLYAANVFRSQQEGGIGMSIPEENDDLMSFRYQPRRLLGVYCRLMNLIETDEAAAARLDAEASGQEVEPFAPGPLPRSVQLRTFVVKLRRVILTGVRDCFTAQTDLTEEDLRTMGITRSSDPAEIVRAAAIWLESQAGSDQYRREAATIAANAYAPIAAELRATEERGGSRTKVAAAATGNFLWNRLWNLGQGAWWLHKKASERKPLDGGTTPTPPTPPTPPTGGGGGDQPHP